MLLTGCGSDVELGRQVEPINFGVRDTSLAAVGYLRRSTSVYGNCTLTLIEPQVAMTAAHCFGRFANGCETLPEALRDNEVVFTPRGDDSDSVRFGIAAIAIAPGAYSPSLGDCGGAWGGYSCSALPPTRSGNDLALVKLSSPVPSSVAVPIPLVTSVANDSWAPHGVHALLDSPTGPMLRTGSLPPAVVTGFGLSAECDHQRRIAQMDFYAGALPRVWHRGCVAPQYCDSSFVYSESSRCEEQMIHAPGRWSPPNSIPYDNIRLSRSTLSYEPETYVPIYDGPIINEGDSGGPLLVRLDLPSAPRGAFYVLGAASASTNTAHACGENPANRFMIADYSVAFGTRTGPWIERTLSAWLDVPPPWPRPRPTCPAGPCRPLPF